MSAEVKRVPELVPPDLAKASGFVLDQRAPIAEPEELEKYEAIIFGTPTRFGNMCAQMRNFLDRTGALWMRSAGSRQSASPVGQGRVTRPGRATRSQVPHAR